MIEEYDAILDPERFVIAGASGELTRDAEAAAAEIDSRRPLPAKIVQRIEEGILAERVHSSAVTEGNRLSRRETLVVLSTGVIEAGSRRDVVEVKNLARAIVCAEETLRDGRPLTPTLLRHLHSLLMDGLDECGVYRSTPVAISGARVKPPPAQDVPDLVARLMRRAEERAESGSALQLATWVHWALARIHPFKDGNGRIARLAQDYFLLRGKLVPAPLQSEDRDGGYYQGLEAADLGDGRDLLEMVAKNVLSMADKYLSIIREEEDRDSWLDGIAKVAMEKVRQTNHRRFLAVQRVFNAVKAEVKSIGDQIASRVPQLSVGIRDYGTIDFDQFMELESQGRAKRNWLVGVDLRVGESQLRYIFWYGCHHKTKWDPDGDFPSRVVLLLSMEEERDYFQLLDNLDEDRVSLRELAPVGSLVLRRRFEPVGNRHEWDKGITPGVAVRDFYQEALGKLGLI